MLSRLTLPSLPDETADWLNSLSPGDTVVMKGRVSIDREATVDRVGKVVVSVTTGSRPHYFNRATGWAVGDTELTAWVSIHPATPQALKRIHAQLATSLQTYPWPTMDNATLQRFADLLAQVEKGE